MTERNNKLRETVRKIEGTASACLYNQPHDDHDCERHLERHLAKIAEMSGDFRGLVEVQAYDIEWDTDGKKVKLPKSVRIMMDSSEDIDETIADKLSDKYGWCVKSCNWRKV